MGTCCGRVHVFRVLFVVVSVVKVCGDDAAVSLRDIYSWSLIAGLSPSPDKHDTTSSVAVPVATVTAFSPPRACALLTSRPCTSVCGRQPARSATRIIRLDLTSSHAPPSASSSSSSSATVCDARLSQRHQHRTWSDKVSALLACYIG